VPLRLRSFTTLARAPTARWFSRSIVGDYLTDRRRMGQRRSVPANLKHQQTSMSGVLHGQLSFGIERPVVRLSNVAI